METAKLQSPHPGSAEERRPPVAAKPPRSALGKLLRQAGFTVLMLGTIGGVGWLVAGPALQRRDKEALPPETSTRPADPKTIAVTVAPVTIQPVQRTVQVVGTLYGYEEVAISAKIEGRVIRIVHDVAERVRPGEPLVEIDPTDVQLALRQTEKALMADLAGLGLTEPPPPNFDVAKLPVVQQAEIQRENAKLRLDRARRLAGRSVIADEELTDKMSELKAAEASYANQLLLAKATVASIEMRQEALKTSQQRLKDAVIRAPQPTQAIPGASEEMYVISDRNVSEGSYVRIGDPVARLVIDQTLKLRVLVPERHSAVVQNGQHVQVTVSSQTTPVAGTVVRINPAVDVVTRTFEVEIIVPNPGGRLKPGGFAKAAISTRTDEAAVTVPLEALVSFAGVNKIFVKEGDKVREVQVVLGDQHTEWVEIISPVLKADETVIISGQAALADGSTVFIRTTATEQPGEATEHNQTAAPANENGSTTQEGAAE